MYLVRKRRFSLLASKVILVGVILMVELLFMLTLLHTSSILVVVAVAAEFPTLVATAAVFPSLAVVVVIKCKAAEAAIKVLLRSFLLMHSNLSLQCCKPAL